MLPPGSLSATPAGLYLAQLGFQQFRFGNVDEGHHHAVDHVFHRAVRHDAHVVPAPRLGRHLAFGKHQAADHFLRVGFQARVVEVVDDIAERTAQVGLDQLVDLRGRRREAADAQGAVEEDGGDVGAVEQVLHVAVDQRQVVHFRLQLGVDRVQLFVERLHLFLRGGQLLVGRLQFLIGRLQFLVGRFEFLARGLHFVAHGLDFIARLRQLLLQLQHLGIGRAAAAHFGRQRHAGKGQEHHAAQATRAGSAPRPSGPRPATGRHDP